MRFLLLLIVVAVSYAGETPFQQVPTSETVISNKNSRFRRAWFTNTTSGALTVTIRDQSTNCGGSPCQLVSATSIPANTSMEVPDTGGVPAFGGLTWQASDVGVQGWVQWE